MFVDGNTGMAHAIYLKEKALQLRRERKLTIDELAERLALSRSTIYYWVKDVPIPPTPRRTAAQLRAARANGEKYRLIREAEYERGLEEYAEFLQVPTFRDFGILFLTEGHKRNRKHRLDRKLGCRGDAPCEQLAARTLPQPRGLRDSVPRRPEAR
jgi:transcriptional regulator with XRE-family HTH domain